MGAFYKVNFWLWLGGLKSNYIPFQAVGDCVYPVMFGGPAPGEIGLDLIPVFSYSSLGEKEKDKLKEVLGWVDGFVKVTIWLNVAFYTSW